VNASPDLYIRLPQGTGGLPSDSILLLDQARSLDAARVRRFLGSLAPETFDGVLGQWSALFKRGS
jgi:mRNA-degrading endonuclease toxin of MazEF toxin-antitoxin module